MKKKQPLKDTTLAVMEEFMSVFEDERRELFWKVLDIGTLSGTFGAQVFIPKAGHETEAEKLWARIEELTSRIHKISQWRSEYLSTKEAM